MPARRQGPEEEVDQPQAPKSAVATEEPPRRRRAKQDIAAEIAGNEAMAGHLKALTKGRTNQRKAFIKPKPLIETEAEQELSLHLQELRIQQAARIRHE